MDKDIAQSIAGMQSTIIGVWFVIDSADLIGSVAGGLLIAVGTYLVGREVVSSFRESSHGT